ncbi:MAG TPA: ATP-binding protein, partial [Tissierellaceae bacterium]|nr:ATP-binding protein [Tissierellaceae bacterium]
SNSKFINVFINPVFSDNILIGAVLLFVDSTEKHKADLIRKEFSANVSHELKTPLTSINGYAEMIENGLVQGEDIKIFASIIKKEGDRLLKLIDSIIKLSKIENQVPNKDMDYVDLYSIAKVVSQRLNIFIKEKNLTFLLRGESTFVKANPTLIEELIYNLLDNSIKYTETCGIITIDIYQELSKAIIKIKDSGVGIPIEHQDRIFERFYIVNKNRPHKTKSTGLGLSIVKHIVQYHNASINLVSEPNKGTEIIIKFNL